MVTRYRGVVLCEPLHRMMEKEPETVLRAFVV
jgi:hypothetical protein